ncbi:MAG: transcriptional regulator NrdR, partial [Dehalococcoidia bacterium]
MQCPFCSYADSKVTDSRTVDAGIRRRRECLRCNARFTTYERVQPAELLVIKKDARREEFSREKLLAGIRKACEKRPLDTAAITAMVDGIEMRLVNSGRSEVSSTGLGELVMDALRELDQIAYVRYASVYRAFADLDALRDVLDELEHAPGRTGPPREQLPLL